MASTTARGAFPYPASTDPDNVPGDMQALADRMAAVGALYSHEAPRPAAGIPGRLHRHPVTEAISYDTGTAWEILVKETAANAAYVAKADVAAITVPAFESTTSTAFTDLATVGPSRNVTIGPSGRALVFVAARQITDAGGNFALTSYAISGATTRAAGDANSLFASGGSSTINHQGAQVFEEVGLAPGSTTFTLKYRASAGTATFERRRIVVIPL